MINTTHAQELDQGQCFAFGQNWSNFLRTLNDERILEAERSLKQMLEVESLQGKRFIDAGSGSGLFSLAARRLGYDYKRIDQENFDASERALVRGVGRLNRVLPLIGWLNRAFHTRRVLLRKLQSI